MVITERILKIYVNVWVFDILWARVACSHMKYCLKFHLWILIALQIFFSDSIISITELTLYDVSFRNCYYSYLKQWQKTIYIFKFWFRRHCSAFFISLSCFTDSGFDNITCNTLLCKSSKLILGKRDPTISLRFYNSSKRMDYSYIYIPWYYNYLFYSIFIK